MQQASILMTFFVMVMGGAYLGLETGMIDISGFVDQPAIEAPASPEAPAAQPAGEVVAGQPAAAG